MDLAGTWRAAPADEALRRAFPAPDLDDAGWAELEVPGHWRSAPEFATSDGPVLYRRRFAVDPRAPGRRRWLTLDGVFYDGDVWLDGTYVGATEGYFFPHTFEVTDTLDGSREHLLAVEVGCAPPADRTQKRNLTGVFQHWDCLDPTWNPGGIWRPVRVTETGPVRLHRVRVLCTDANAERASLAIRAELDAATARTATLRVTVVAPDGAVVADIRSEHRLAHGANRIRLGVPIEQPALWWPHALGRQPLHDVLLEVLLDEGEPSDRRTIRTGLRQVRMKHWILTVNGERLFVKGSNHGPTRMALAEATPGELAADVRRAREAGLDLLRIHAHVSRPELYEAADRLGVLLWQDLPLQWGYARTVRRQAVRQAREAVDLLGHHPAVALWCGHNEPLALDVDPGVTNPAKLALTFAAMQALPTWNKSVLDRSVGRALERADPTRPVVPHSGVFPGPLSGGTDTHLYCGWYHGGERDFPRILAAVPRLARFVTEFGAQAVPPSADWMDPHRWPDLDWAELGRRHALQLEAFERFVPPAAYPTFDAWRAATQEYQATVIRFHVETLRRLKYRPTGGFCHFFFADGHPAVTWSVLDHERRPKAGYAALAAACAPVIVVAERPAPTYEPGGVLALDVHVVNDLRRTLSALQVTGTVSWPGGEARTGWTGDVPPDSCVRIGTLRATLPDQPAPVRVSLALDGDGITARNSYTSEVA
ncbi:MAG: glycoside hydrolase family 2 TIM barrel-domain containing protein [Acidimicrobiales bacterium]